MVRADKCARDLIKDFIVEYALNPSFTDDTDKDDKDDEADDEADKHTSDEQDRADDEQGSDDDPLDGRGMAPETHHTTSVLEQNEEK